MASAAWENVTASSSRSTAWWRSRQKAPRRRISPSPAVTSCSRRSSRFWRPRSGAGGEIQLTDAMIGLARKQKFYGVEFEGERHDCGSKSGFLRANIAFGMARADLRDGLRAEMKKYLEK